MIHVKYITIMEYTCTCLLSTRECRALGTESTTYVITDNIK